MRKLTAWTAGTVMMLCFWTVLFLGIWGRTGRIVIGGLTVLALIYGIIRLALYRPDFERGAGTLEEVKQISKLKPLEEPPPTCPEDGEKGDEKTKKCVPE